jgi:Uma2 family endonuclease
MAVLERESGSRAAASQVHTVNGTNGASYATDPMELRPWTWDDYHHMGEAGILGPDERVELIKGQVVKMSPIGPFHSTMTDPLRDMLRAAFGEGFTVRAQNPIVLDGPEGQSEPEPDVAVVVGSWLDYRTSKPEAKDIRLIVEIADSSLEYDRTEKMKLYAAVGITDYWIVNLRDKQVEVYRGPAATVYADVRVYDPDQDIEPLHAPGRPVAVGALIKHA